MKKLTQIQKNILLMTIIGCGGALLCLPFAFIDLGGSKWPGLSLGVLLGTVIEIICHILLIKGASLMTATTKRGAGLAVLFNLLRLALFVGGLVLGAFCTFVWSGNWLNVFAIALAYLPATIIIIINKLKEPKEVK